MVMVIDNDGDCDEDEKPDNVDQGPICMMTRKRAERIRSKYTCMLERYLNNNNNNNNNNYKDNNNLRKGGDTNEMLNNIIKSFTSKTFLKTVLAN